ncbi:MAG TPA: Gfo/Idh/MocA family oxidoreductase [Phycisphaerae bacterium]|jgi:predicted dehydrogenase|nr:Gfo/Idh/MocA family oxidoreductase [Phycisphaerae bacterium]HOB74887.1 Gfo/Idh/MocA family oxidoreductase [Phycisphaerae bacterium]HOJ53749.1 Gfo/Idh/MocA family oxidoreductase [Phycisphaerae bacterium]HOL27290.1 Gfo/Idh/MocA family oxidoreductase [Phycisphaerae bacterium]HPP22832.1 Gfo/Idh/MocA family oxidoreductase [Phycisphaerae bacterium]
MDTVRVGLIGTGFVSDLHAAAFKMVPGAEVVGVAGSSVEKAQRFAGERGIAKAFGDYRALLDQKDVDMVTVACPNYLHAEVTVAAAAAGKHVVCEKPLCRTLEQADQMIEACRKAGVLLMYAEELCFAPKYVRAKQLVDEGALGKAFLVKQSEEHFGPHSAWFWDVDRSGGGVLLDMGCHSIEYARWVFGKPQVKSVWAQLGTHVHADKTRGEDHAICTVEYEGGLVGLAENSWAKTGGVDDRCEIYGSAGFTRADLLRGSSLLTYSEVGYGYAVEKAATTKGYTFTMFEEIWNYGFPQEMAHFCRCVRGEEQPIETGEDGREVLKIIYAAYESAGTGKRIEWPYEPKKVEKPIDLWKK